MSGARGVGIVFEVASGTPPIGRHDA